MMATTTSTFVLIVFFFVVATYINVANGQSLLAPKTSDEQAATNAAVFLFRRFDYCQTLYGAPTATQQRHACFVSTFTPLVTPTTKVTFAFPGTPDLVSGPGASGIADIAVALAVNLGEAHMTGQAVVTKVTEATALSMLPSSSTRSSSDEKVDAASVDRRDGTTTAPLAGSSSSSTALLSRYNYYIVSYIDNDICVDPVDPENPSAPTTCTKYYGWKRFIIRIDSLAASNPSPAPSGPGTSYVWGTSGLVQVLDMYEYIHNILKLTGEECTIAGTFRPVHPGSLDF